jgi:hypothetical protein
MAPTRGFALVLGLGLIVGTAWGEEAPDDSWKDNPRIGGAQGMLRYRIARAPYEFVETPDVVTLKDGTKLEAYFLQTYGDWFVFYVKETGQSWLKEEVPRALVARVDFDQYLERDPVEPRVIERAKKQPVPKDEILAGTFTARRGRFSTWRMTFRSEVDKQRPHSEDATEYGIFEVESHSDQSTATSRFEHKTRSSGKYFLYAPGTVNNKDWVLVLAEVVQSEVDKGKDIVVFTDTMADETMIIDFSDEADAFRLEWSNLGGWSWTSLVDLRFRRESEPSDPKVRYRSLEDRREVPGAAERPGNRRATPPPWSESPRLVASGKESEGPSTTAARKPSVGYEWQVGRWGKPVTYWNGGR